MDQQQTIIAAMTKLDEFTVADIVDATGAISSTVRTVLRRNEGLVERIGVLGEDRRGGRWIRYRVRKGADVELPPEPAAVAPDTILAALGLLIDELPDAATPRARELLLRRAEHFLTDDRSRFTPELESEQVASAHTELARLMLEVGRAESGVAPVIAPARWVAIEAGLRAIQPNLDPELAAAAGARLMNSSAASAISEESSDLSKLRHLAALFGAFAEYGMSRVRPATRPMAFGSAFAMAPLDLSGTHPSVGVYAAHLHQAGQAPDYGPISGMHGGEAVYARCGMINRSPGAVVSNPSYFIGGFAAAGHGFDATGRAVPTTEGWPASGPADAPGWGAVA